MRRELRISREARAAIAAHALAEAPLECCGLLVGVGERIVDAVPTANVDASPVRYTLDPQAYLRTARAARQRQLDVVGAFHSHPSSAPVPSATDLAEGVDAPFVYIIAGPVATGQDLAVRAWEKRADGFVELRLRLDADGDGDE